MPIFLLLFLLLGARQASALPSAEEEGLPKLVQLVMVPEKNGVFVRLPMFDTDPNTGLTYGVMPVWVSLNSSGAIRDINMGMVDYNQNFKFTGNYQLFYFPNSETSYNFYASYSQRTNREFTGEYASSNLLGRGWDAYGRLQYLRDGSQRFYGFGPDAPLSGQSNYTIDMLDYHVTIGIPLRDGSPWKINFVHHLESDAVNTGAVESVPDLQTIYPAVAQSVAGSERDAYFATFLSYDTRDSAQTTSHGSYAAVSIRGSNRDLLSEYNYYRYAVELKTFSPLYDRGDPEPRFITAARFHLEQLNGSAPFWALPTLGGKYSLRAYGDDRFRDNGMMTAGVEERCRIYERKISSATASFWIDPFIGVGTVFSSPELMQEKYLHPVAGAALRAVARPQIVGSADFGYGQEGLKVFLDVNYSF